MTNDEIKGLWESQPTGAPTVSPEAIWRVAQASERFERTIFWRDTREWIATALVAGFFGFLAFSQGPVRWLLLGAALMALFPMTYATIVRRQHPVPPSNRHLIAHLRGAIASVGQQIGLLSSVVWWYLLPLAGSLLLVAVDRWDGQRLQLGGRMVFSWGFTALIFVGVWWLNRRCVRQDLAPRLHELELMLEELER